MPSSSRGAANIWPLVYCSVCQGLVVETIASGEQSGEYKITPVQ
jgi:hypothetical protein